MNKVRYIIKQVINGLVFIKEVDAHIGIAGRKHRKAKFKCYCGNEFETLINSVKCGNTSSCGCYHRKLLKLTKHGLCNHPLYKVWADMKSRCYNKNHKKYNYWGGRGIIICDEWKYNFKKFYDWALENGYKKGLTIDREENDDDYTPDNCRFVTTAENNRNSRTTKLKWNDIYEIRNIKLLIPGVTQTEIAKSYGVSYSTIGGILNNRAWI